MSRYTMNQIVTLTGINAHTLRKWESRYSLLKPERTSTNIRFYSDTQLKKLLNISVLTRNGYRISKIDKMSDDEIYEVITNKLIDRNNDDEISALVLKMLEFDEKGIDKILKTQIIKRGLLSTTIEIIYPLLSQVGVLWGMNKVMPAQEHFISNIIKKKIFAAIDLLPLPEENSSSIIMFLPENENHEIGLLVAYYIARELGWKVYYLGQNVPTENLQNVIRTVNPDAMLTMLITPAQDLFSNIVSSILEQGSTKLFVSGNPNNFQNFLDTENVEYLAKPNDLIDSLNKFR